MRPNGTALRALRQVQQLSLRDLARLAQTTASQISRIEREEISSPGEELLRRLADALHVSVDDITRGDPVPPKPTPEREVPYPGTPEGQLFHYRPEEAARFLPWSALQLRRKAHAREIPHNNGASRVTFTGRDIQEISDMTAQRPLAETVQRRSA